MTKSFGESIVFSLILVIIDFTPDWKKKKKNCFVQILKNYDIIQNSGELQFYSKILKIIIYHLFSNYTI